MKIINKEPLSLSVYNADEKSFGVTSVIVSGQSEAVLIDAQFTLADAEKLVEVLKETGKKLIAVYISHGDPDYYFGLEVIKKNYPEVTVYATPATIAHIKNTSQKKLDIWGPQLGDNGTKNIVLPQELKGDSISLEGNEIRIMGLDGNSPERTFVWIPSIKAVIGGVPIFGDLHLWMADAATSEARKQWVDILDSIQKLAPEIVVPGHLKIGSEMDISALNYTLGYLKSYDEEVAKAKDSAELIDSLKNKYPQAGMIVGLTIGAKVNKGEMKW